MNKLHWIFNQYRAPEGDDGASNGGAPAPEPETNDGEGVDWEALSEGVEQGADEGGGSSEVVLDDPLPTGALSSDPEGNPDPNATTQEPKTEEPAPVETPVAKTPEQEAAEQEALVTRFKEWQQSETQRLVKEYAFDEDTAARLQTEPELVLPELAAKMQMNMTQQIVEIVQRMMPSMVQPVLANNTSEAKAKDFFLEHNPDLDLTKHQAAVLEAGKAFRKLNPKATPEQAAKAIGQIVRTSLGLETPAPTPRAKAGPHRPVAAGAKTAPAPKPVTGNKWADLAEDD
jgi:hypothetical protein